jgi:phosphatidylglycerol:prolipoprotein diacylglycerol transferase
MTSEFLIMGVLPVSGYMLFNTLAAAVGAAVILYLAKKEGLDAGRVAVLLGLGITACLLGAKLYSVILHIFESPSAAWQNPGRLWKIFKTGGAFHGAMLAGLIFGILYIRRYFKAQFWRLFDITAVGTALAQAIGRLGCFTAGCCYGTPTDLWWGVRFFALGNDPHPCAGIPLHPVQIYEAALNFFNFLFLFLLVKKSRRPGRTFAFYLVNYGTIRFVMEYFRGDGGRGYLLLGETVVQSLSYPQLLSILLVSAGILIWFTKKEKTQ